MDLSHTITYTTLRSTHLAYERCALGQP